MHARARMLVVGGAVFTACFLTPYAHGQKRNALPDRQIVQEAQLVASSGRVDVFQHGVDVSPALARMADAAVTRMEAILNRKLDESTLGPRIEIYVSNGTSISHVWLGYEHQRDPRGIVFLNTHVAAAAIQGTNATYAHELAHLIHPNHTAAFWNEVDKVMPDYRERKDWLRDNGAGMDL